MGLEQYTLEELQAEIKRRKSAERKEKSSPKKKEYAELTGEVTYISKPVRGNSNKVKDYSFKVRFNDDELFSFKRVQSYQNNYEHFAVDKNLIKSVDELLAVGDKVVVRSCITNFFPPFSGTNWDEENVIIKVIKKQ
jgi:hypothetical protein